MGLVNWEPFPERRIELRVILVSSLTKPRLCGGSEGGGTLLVRIMESFVEEGTLDWVLQHPSEFSGQSWRVR